MSIQRVVRASWVCVASLGCSGTTPKTVSISPVPVPTQSSSCLEAQRLVVLATELRDQHRFLRAELFLERAKELCDSAITVPAETPAQYSPVAELEEVYGWLATQAPAAFLNAESLGNTAAARRLERASLQLQRDLGQRITAEPKRHNYSMEPLFSGNWLSHSEGSLSRKGEWFERFVLPECTENWIAGPFLEQVVICAQNVKREKTYLFYDLATGQILAKRPVGANAGWIDELT